MAANTHASRLLQNTKVGGTIIFWLTYCSQKWVWETVKVSSQCRSTGSRQFRTKEK